MARKKKPRRMRSAVAKDLRTPKYKMKVVKDRRKREERERLEKLADNPDMMIFI